VELVHLLILIRVMLPNYRNLTVSEVLLTPDALVLRGRQDLPAFNPVGCVDRQDREPVSL
jgi:hypothetical protein